MASDDNFLSGSVLLSNKAFANTSISLSVSGSKNFVLTFFMNKSISDWSFSGFATLLWTRKDKSLVVDTAFTPHETMYPN